MKWPEMNAPLPSNAAETSTASKSWAGKLVGFVILSLIFLALSLMPQTRAWFSVERITDFSRRIGAWGPVLILLLGTVTPLMFLPRWPIAVVAGMLYGAWIGTLLANLASTLGAALHYAMARSLLGPLGARLLRRRSTAEPISIPREHAFLALLFLRAFPLSNFVATNLLAGSLRIPFRTYLVSSFLGMIPSTLMYAAWGKLVKQPSAGFYAIAGLSLLFILGGTVLAHRKFLPWLRALRHPEGAPDPTETPHEP